LLNDLFNTHPASLDAKTFEAIAGWASETFYCRIDPHSKMILVLMEDRSVLANIICRGDNIKILATRIIKNTHVDYSDPEFFDKIEVFVNGLL